MDRNTINTTCYEDLGVFPEFEFVNQSHFLLNDAIDDVLEVSARPACETFNLTLQLLVEIDWESQLRPMPVELPTFGFGKVVFLFRLFRVFSGLRTGSGSSIAPTPMSSPVTSEPKGRPGRFQKTFTPAQPGTTGQRIRN